MKKVNHINYEIDYHLVRSTKYNYNIIDINIAKRCRELIKKYCNEMVIYIINGCIKRNYIHILISCPPDISVDKIVNILKTSKVLLNEFKELKTRYRRKDIWGKGYFCYTAGNINNRMIKDYINESDDYKEIFTIVR